MQTPNSFVRVKMAGLKLETLPILLISAKDQNSVNAIIAEIIGNDDPERSGGDKSTDCVWTLVNKYYTADVRLHALLDGQELDERLVDSVEAHLIYMSEDECAGADAADVMRRRAAAAPRARVRVVAAEGGEGGAAPDAPDAPDALAAASCAARLELVPLREAPAHERDECGLDRVRAAFHAHVWPGLVRRGCDDSAASEWSGSGSRSRSGSGSGSEAEWSAWRAGPAAAGAFAAALGALPAAAAAAARASGAGPDERRARAEHLVAAFCRALGDPLD